ncbi:MAG: STAS domain-containing protein [Phycisphaerae bacterium]
MSEEFVCTVTAPEPGVSVATLRGDIDLQSSPMLREELLELLESGIKRLIIDLAGVGYMDSSGVGTLVDLKRRVERVGGGVALVAPQPRVRNVFEITRLDRFFKIVDTLDEARRA